MLDSGLHQGTGPSAAWSLLLLLGEAVEDPDPEGAGERRASHDGPPGGVHHHPLLQRRVGVGRDDIHGGSSPYRGKPCPMGGIPSGRKVKI